MTKITVLGSNSFSGSHFVAHCLESGHSVMGISRSEQPSHCFLPYVPSFAHSHNFTKTDEHPEFAFFKLDINNDLIQILDVIDSFKPDIIVNFLAQGMVAQSWESPVDWYQTNLLSQVAFHDQLRTRDYLKKYVHITTPEVYGTTNGTWLTESSNFNPSTPYAVSRAACDLHLHSFYKAYNFPVVFTRAANVYGPGQQLYRIIPRTILSGISGTRMSLHGGGLSNRAFIHISDVVKATLTLALEAKPGTTWHISSNQSISIKNLVETIFDSMNVNFEDLVDIVEDRLGKDQDYLLDSAKLRHTFQWSDKVNLEDGINETVLWCTQHYDILKDLPWNYVHKK